MLKQKHCLRTASLPKKNMTDTKIKAQGAKGDDAIAPQVQINARYQREAGH